MADDPFADLFQCKVAQPEEPRTDEKGQNKEVQDTEESSHGEGQVEQEAGDEKDNEGDVAVPPGPRQRRSSRVLGPDAAGCYLSFDHLQVNTATTEGRKWRLDKRESWSTNRRDAWCEVNTLLRRLDKNQIEVAIDKWNRKKWVGMWSATVIADVVAYMRPKSKVPQFKYTKREKIIFKSEAAAAALRDERKDFFRGLCLFVKLAKEFKGEFLLISKADLDERKVRLFALTNEKEVKALDSEDVFYDASNLKAAAVVASSPTSVYTAKTMDLPTFVAEAGKEGGTAVSFEG